MDADERKPGPEKPVDSRPTGPAGSGCHIEARANMNPAFCVKLCY